MIMDKNISYEKSLKPVRINIVSHPENLKRIRNQMKDITSRAGFSQKDSGIIILAVDEACSNIIKHGYDNDHNRKIDLTVSLETDRLIISIIDNGIKFDINEIEPEDQSRLKPGGLGLFIIKQVMDKVEYGSTSQGYNKLKMIKFFHHKF